MIALLQRVSRASVTVGGRVTGAIGPGLLVFLGVRQDDAAEDAVYLAGRVARMRLFHDSEGKMNLPVTDTGGAALVVSQFTLHADTRKGNRPGFALAADPALAELLYDRFVAELRLLLGVERVATGEFRAMMDVDLVNDGPVTVLVKSKSEYGCEP